ncbi:MAG: chromate efflux transporter [Thermoleophilia bacterium]|nr:chromate efflux transporter [Thermoleophilia bacterium]
MAPVSARAVFVNFLRLGLTAFGGPAIVAYIQRWAVVKKQWLTPQSFAEGLAICQTIPGATNMQMAAYVGLRAGALPGAIAAYVGFGLPSFCLMLALAVLYQRGHQAELVVSVLGGLRAVVLGLVAHAALSLGRAFVRSWWELVVVAGAGVAFFLGVHPLYVALAAGAVGLVLPAVSGERSGLSGAAEELQPLSLTRAPFRLLAVLLFLAAVSLFVLYVFQRQLFSLAMAMLRIGLFAFGGAYGAIPLMQHELVDVHKWITSSVLMDGIALGQITPGPVLVTATFVGYVVAGLPGALVGTVAIFFPSFVVLLLVVPYFARVRNSMWLQKAVVAIVWSFVGLIAATAVNLGLQVNWRIWEVILAAGSFAGLCLRLEPAWIVLGGGVISLVIGLLVGGV